MTTYQIDPTTGALRAVGQPAPSGHSPVAATVDPSGHFAYIANLDSTALYIPDRPCVGCVARSGRIAGCYRCWTVVITTDPAGTLRLRYELLLEQRLSLCYWRNWILTLSGLARPHRNRRNLNRHNWPIVSSPIGCPIQASFAWGG